MARKTVTIDGNQSCAHIAYHCSEVCAIYPITPSSPMGEWADLWASERKPNIFGTVPTVAEMQAEGGAAGAVHGALQAGALTTTFTASQGLLLMIPNMHKIAGELTSAVFHVSARTIATHALSIFGDHSDTMACRNTGWAMLASGSVQEVNDLALISHAATLESRIPFLHFFDGFRTSHEIQKLEQSSVDDIKAMIDPELVRAHRSRALTPDAPLVRGTAQNPDVFFQARETVNKYYDACPAIVQKHMDKFKELTGREYKLYQYVGAADAERVVILMGSGAETADETVVAMNQSDEKVGVLKVRLYRPFSIKDFVNALPKTVKKIAVLDRTKEPGANGEPLYLDTIAALSELNAVGELPLDTMPLVIGGRYGLSSKEFTPAMVKSVFDNLNAAKPKNHFTIGIIDDVTHTSLEWDPNYSIESDDVTRAVFFGLGSDGTVGANKNSIKIIGEGTDNYAQGYFVYDSKKSGSMTVSHLRFGPRPIQSIYLISHANFVACHQFEFMHRVPVLDRAVTGATFLLNAPFGPDEIWDKLTKRVQKQIIDKKLKFYVIDADKVAAETGMGRRINVIMQTCFFGISGVLPRDEAIKKIKEAVKKTYGKRGDEVVQKNYAAMDLAMENLHEVTYPNDVTSSLDTPPVVSDKAPEFVKNVTAEIMAMNGDMMPVSKFPVDGTFPTATTQWEKRNVALNVPVWEPDVCIQCGKCSISCPHAVIRMKIVDGDALADKPAGFKVADARGKGLKDSGKKFTIQVAVEDCTGCGLCVEVCPAKNKQDPSKKAINMAPQIPLREEGRVNWDYFLSLPETDESLVNLNSVKGSQLRRPLFEFSGACPGCGETPYIKLATQLFGDRMLIANATGCSSIYGGNLPTTPYAKDANGRGPAWSNSLFEDNAEFGFGMYLAVDKNREIALNNLDRSVDEGLIDAALRDELVNADQSTDAGIVTQRVRVNKLKSLLSGKSSETATMLLNVADYLVKKSIWIIGGDGWAYDIGYGGLDHVLAQGKNVNVLVLDTEVYSNTGGQASKATARGAVAKFAASGKKLAKKDMALIAMTYGNIYVAKVALGANEAQCVKAFIEAEAYDGPSIIIAYSPCIAHGFDLSKHYEHEKFVVESGHFPLLRYNPELAKEGKNPLVLDSKAPKISYKDFALSETRFKMLTKSMPEEAERLLGLGQQDCDTRWSLYKQMSEMTYGKPAAVKE